MAIKGHGSNNFSKILVKLIKELSTLIYSHLDEVLTCILG